MAADRRGLVQNLCWVIADTRPNLHVLFAICGVLIALAIASALIRRDWRGKLAEAQAGEKR